MNKESSPQERMEAMIKTQKLARDGSKIRHRNRCNLTGRPRGYYRFCGISRVALRENAGFGLIPGILKSSW
jgi:small subunit ribosomal protein S14